MGNDDGARKKKKTNRATKVPPPVWAQRLRLALAQAGFIDDKGEIDKSRLADHFSVHPKTITHWLNGRNEPRYKVLVEVSNISSLSIDWILARGTAPPISTPLPIAKEYRPASGEK